MTDVDQLVKPRKRRVWAIALVTLATIALFATWRATSLSGLPDVGDPFDVAAFADEPIPDDRNAFTLYRQAAKLMTRQPTGATHDWATADEAQKRWLEANREALELWRRGTERPEALGIPLRTITFGTALPVITEMRTFARMASLEATRLEAMGEFDRALTWHVAALRSGRHCGTRGVILERLVGIAINQSASRQIGRWAADPRVDAVMLRRAIDAALAAEAMTRPTSEAFRVEYLMIMNSIDDPRLMVPELMGIDAPTNQASRSDSPIARAWRDDIPRLLKREPERSRRVVRLIFANELAYCDLPASRQPPIAATLPPDYVPTATGTAVATTANPLLGELYAVDASAPEAALALSPAEIARWWDSTVYARICVPSHGKYHQAVARERATQATLLATLRAEFAKREHPQPIGAAGDRP